MTSSRGRESRLFLDEDERQFKGEAERVFDLGYKLQSSLEMLPASEAPLAAAPPRALDEPSVFPEELSEVFAKKSKKEASNFNRRSLDRLEASRMPGRPRMGWESAAREGDKVLSRDGLLLRWSRATYGNAVEETVIRSDPKEARRVFTQLEQMNFTSIKYNKFGNMTCSLTLRQDSSSHSVSWEFGDPLAPSQVVALALHLQQLGSPAVTN